MTRTLIYRCALIGALLLESSACSQQPAHAEAPQIHVARAERVVLPHGREFFVAPAGTPAGDGSRARPWDIETALRQPAGVRPGDTIWIRGGRYGSGDAHAVLHSALVGTARDPILVRAWPGERAIIDAWLQVGCCEGEAKPAEGSFVWFWGLEIAGFNPDRTSAPSGPPSYSAMQNHAGADSWAAGARFINCIVHDTSGGLSLWQENSGGEAYGNIVYHVGGQGPDRGHGHGFYAQNAGGMKHIADNIVFNNFGHGMQVYGSRKSQVRNFLVEGNAVFNNGSIANASSASDNFLFAGGEGGAQEIRLIDNYTYFRPGLNGYNELGYAWSESNGAAEVRGNYFVGGLDPVDVWRWQSFTFAENVVAEASHPLLNLTRLGGGSYRFGGNSYYGSGRFTDDKSGKSWDGWRAAGLDKDSRYTGGHPSGAAIFVRPNRYDAGRANIVIYNWDGADKVPVDVSAVLQPGTSYELRDAQNFFGPPVLSGVYKSGALQVPMTGLTPAQPNGNVPRPAVHTAPEFGVFVLQTVAK